MRSADAAKFVGDRGDDPQAGGRFVVFIAPGWTRIMRVTPLARRSDGEVCNVKHFHERGLERLQASLRPSTWAEAAEGLPPGLYYLH
jgi:hypothetical protein